MPSNAAMTWYLNAENATTEGPSPQGTMKDHFTVLNVILILGFCWFCCKKPPTAMERPAGLCSLV